MIEYNIILRKRIDKFMIDIYIYDEDKTKNNKKLNKLNTANTRPETHTPLNRDQTHTP